MRKDSHTKMTAVRLSEGISLVFDQETLSNSASPPLSTRSRSRSSHGSSKHSSGSGSRAHRREACTGRRHRSSSSTSSSSSSPRPRSRSHPRCHRAASRSRCSHPRRHRRSHHSSPQRKRAHSRSSSPSSPPRRSSHRSRPRSSAGRTADHRKPMGSFRAKSSKSTKTNRSHSRSPGRLTVRLNLDGKTDDIWIANTKPGAEESPRLTTPEPQPNSDGWVTLEPAFQKSPTQNSDLEPEDDGPSPKMSPTRKGISFSINNAVAKPTMIATSAESKVIHRVESYSSRAPYGHWMPVKRVPQTSLSRSSKHSLATSH
ncbi:arginine/serine-rich protein 1 [Osmerus eperlanus]|uniref:arginine/serine-rich protein 1 n=1 Tax=Osmerus eperlanus TaxID=29151 RepID=UPI002E1555D2